MAKKKRVGDVGEHNAVASLHFLKSGDYLLVDHERGGASKFLTAPSVMAAFTSFGRDSGWMPAGLVRHGLGANGVFYVYSAPAQKVQIVLNGQEMTVPIPRTVMLHYNQVVYFWALKSSGFDVDAQAYLAPFSNLYGDGHVCWGQNKAPQADPAQARKTWELFFGTGFNFDLGQGKCLKHPQSVTTLLAELDGKSSFPASELVPVNQQKINAIIDDRLKEQ